jgi:transcriptional adapter 2-alpha
MTTQEQHSYPIFCSDWGADEELLLISGLIQYGLGNWVEVSEHVGTRTRDDCERHYLEIYLGEGNGEEAKKVEEGMSADGAGKANYPIYMPPMDRTFLVDPNEFQQRKKARIEDMRRPHSIPPAAAPLVSAPTNHEVGGFMPGRLEFEHEVENDAEMAVKDLEFGLVFKYAGDEQPQAKITRPLEEEGDEEEDDDDDAGSKAKTEDDDDDVKVEPGDEDDDDAPKSKKRKKSEANLDPPQDVEDEDELEIKLALLEIYFSKLDKREGAKDLIFDRALTEHKRVSCIDSTITDMTDPGQRTTETKRRARACSTIQGLCQAADGARL